MRSRAAASIIAGGCLVLATAPASLATTSPATITVFDGLPAVSTDVYAGSQKVVSGLAPGKVSTPIALKPGTYDMTVVPEGSSPATKDGALSTSLTVKAGSTTTLAAFLDADGGQRVEGFVNPTEAPPGQAALLVRHVAQAGPVDLRLNDMPVLNNLPNGVSGSLKANPGTSTLKAVAAGGESTVLGPLEIPVKDGQILSIFVWGKQSDLQVTTQDLAAVKSTTPVPTSVPAGEDPVPGRWSALTLAGAGLAAVGSGLLLIRRPSVTAGR